MFERMLRNFYENFTAILGEFHSILKKISRNFPKSFICIQLQASNIKHVDHRSVTSTSQVSHK